MTSLSIAGGERYLPNIIDFDKVYNDAKVVALEMNYRCTNNIVTAARELIKIIGIEQR